MRWWVAVLLVSALGQVPAAQGQAPEAGGPLLTDAAGDVKIGVDGTQGAPDGARAYLDLVELAAVESAADFTFTLRLADLASGQQTFTGDASYYVRLAHGEATYQLHVQRRVPLGGTAAYVAFVEEGHEDIFGRVLEQVPVTVDATASTVTAAVPRDRLLDLSGASPFPGRALAVTVAAATYPIFGNYEEAGRGRDLMPDDGSTVELPVALGDVQSGDAALFAPDPTRISNGEATTHAFTVLARNLGADEALFTLTAELVPAGWEVIVPVPLLRIPAGGEANATVLASTPFAHDHGLFQSLRAVLTKEGDAASRGTATLGVRFTEVPQPAGHHDTLYLHSRQAQGAFFLPRSTMNTLMEDPNDDGGPLPGSASCQDGPDVRHHFWSMPLDPPLRMGMDFDLARNGTFEATLQATRLMTGFRISGVVVHMGPGGGVGVVAEVPISEPQDLQRDDTLELSLPVVPLPRADLVPYAKDVNLELQLFAESGPGQIPPNLCPDPGEPLLRPGASLRLPLLEYHDPLPVPAASLLAADGPVRRAVAPGSVVVFPVNVTAGRTGATIALDLFGVHSDWARLVGGPSLRLGPDEQAAVAVEVTIPDGTPASERVDLVVQAVPTGAEQLASFLRLVVEVDPAAEQVHEAAAPAEDRGSPEPAAPLVALVALALAVALRRRT